MEIDVGETLLETLRERLHLTGVKKGCAVGECGACTVLIDGTPTNSCIYLAVWADGREVITVEGIAKDGVPSKLQQAFIAEGAIQCGYCTPGFVVTGTAMVESGKRYSREEVKQELAGHLCRCTGYQNIIRAVMKALEQ
ncbi:MAG: (2Fe-2S)-binding protein [Clostridia bacterium]|nr:(2Fe-2S)-binding protein [Clostridia bacterium]